MLYYLLYASGRVPRWLSVWGLIGVPLFLAAGFALAVTGEPNSTFSNVMDRTALRAGDGPRVLA